jgi:F-box protein 11
VIVHGSGGAAVWFEASAGRLANVTIEQVGRTGYGLDVAEGRLVVERCHISSRGNACVAIHGQAQVTVRASRIGPGHEGGIYISQTADAVLADNTVDGNGYHGVEVEHAAGLTMRGNTIFNNQQNGVRIWSTGRVLLEGNEVYQNGWEQVAIGGGSNPTLYRNVIRDGRRSGLYLGKTEGLIQDNTIVGNAASGVDLLAGSNATLRGNHINRNGNYAIWVQAGGGGTVTNNDLRGNDRETWSPGALHELQLRESQNDTDPP